MSTHSSIALSAGEVVVLCAICREPEARCGGGGHHSFAASLMTHAVAAADGAEVVALCASLAEASAEAARRG